MNSSDLPKDSNSPDDTPDLDDIDRRIRINELEHELLDRGMQLSDASDECPPEVHEQFLSNVLAYESAPISCPFDALVKAGVELPDPADLDDAALHDKLWEVIRALAARSIYLYRTDHLSDRELYADLWNDLLREPGPEMPPGSGWINHLDILGGCSEEDIQIGLRYYEDEEERQRWAKEWPNDVIPPHEDPPYDRDRLLPKAPEPRAMEFDGEEFESEDDPDTRL